MTDRFLHQTIQEKPLALMDKQALILIKRKAPVC
jgi:hypothetical protein